MKKLFTIAGILLLVLGALPINAQIGTRFYATTTMPAHATREDSIRLAVSFDVDGLLKHYTREHEVVQLAQPGVPGEINVRYCLQVAGASGFTTYDTFMVGKLPVGDYHVNLAGYWLGPSPNCNPAVDSTKVQQIITIYPTINVTAEAIPQTPTKHDDIALVVHAITGGKAKRHHVSLAGLQMAAGGMQGEIEVDACFGRIEADGNTYHYYDTLHLGKLTMGNYELNCSGTLTLDTNTCSNIYDSSYIADTLVVQPAILVSLEALPAAPTDKDSITILAHTTTAGPAKKMSANASIVATPGWGAPGLIAVNLCYGLTGADRATHTYTDSFMIGALAAGAYYLHASADLAYNTLNCNNILENAQTYDSITVLLSQGIDARRPGGLSIYPNPAGDQLNIEAPEDVKTQEVQIENMQGVKVRAYKPGSRRLNLSGLPAGTYVLRLRIDESVFYKRFVKE